MEEKTASRRGAPKGNQNARKHGFYSRVLDEAEQLDLELATGVDGIDDEIALLRVKIKSVLAHDPDEGHDDFLMSLALLVMASSRYSPRRARGNPGRTG